MLLDLFISSLTLEQVPALLVYAASFSITAKTASRPEKAGSHDQVFLIYSSGGHSQSRINSKLPIRIRVIVEKNLVAKFFFSIFDPC